MTPNTSTTNFRRRSFGPQTELGKQIISGSSSFSSEDSNGAAAVPLSAAHRNRDFLQIQRNIGGSKLLRRRASEDAPRRAAESILDAFDIGTDDEPPARKSFGGFATSAVLTNNRQASSTQQSLVIKAQKQEDDHEVVLQDLFPHHSMPELGPQGVEQEIDDLISFVSDSCKSPPPEFETASKSPPPELQSLRRLTAGKSAHPTTNRTERWIWNAKDISDWGSQTVDLAHEKLLSVGSVAESLALVDQRTKAALPFVRTDDHQEFAKIADEIKQTVKEVSKLVRPPMKSPTRNEVPFR
eukprot:gnl/MRDRNA2_/MRDRNA2_228011_c0_seq1.p1 gnl/MRDRNA2_/MRDRNA2_228011_c0~~gnl/MRDRNA2_/MRDRNA2_228011_c0_seq1.p1  ORF type:complete len:324 (+),score=59.91 gnl/MRDRNA2_/MRDRNA2_228011_c0_seq1:80-973(+)